ncbi:hypothetical protein GCM10022237_46700 [Nocardioides ginsengisoli]|uniref:Uncharacterized protein n=1 Tax=Nocardioides ginsengisoli TaxID=363868 RepID=A0ABW3W496_9ACTN
MAPRTWRQYSPDPEPKGENPAYDAPPAELPHVRTVAERTIRRRPASPRSALIALVAAAAVAGFFTLLNGRGDDADTPPTGPRITVSPQVRPQQKDDFATLLDDIAESNGGSTIVTSAALNDAYAEVTVPDHGPGDERAVRYHWNARGLSGATRTTTSYRPFDLATYRDVITEDLCAQARALLDRPRSCYLLIEETDADEPGPVGITAWAGNDYDQTARIEFDHRGRVLERSGPNAR